LPFLGSEQSHYTSSFCSTDQLLATKRGWRRNRGANYMKNNLFIHASSSTLHTLFFSEQVLDFLLNTEEEGKRRWELRLKYTRRIQPQVSKLKYHTKNLFVLLKVTYKTFLWELMFIWGLSLYRHQYWPWPDDKKVAFFSDRFTYLSIFGWHLHL